MEFDVVLGGLGGQGIRVASQVLAQAAGFEGKVAYQNNIYGGGVRGGAINATVVIADDEVLSPVRDQPWGAVAMDQRHASWFAGIVRPGGILVANSTLARDLPERPDYSIIQVPATELAEKELGNIVVATMIALGVFVEVSGIVKVESVIEAIPEILPPHRRQATEQSQRAVQFGADWVKPLIADRRDFNLALKG